MSIKSDDLKTENNEENSVGFRPWMKVTFLIFGILVILLIGLMVASNVLQDKAKDNLMLPQIPFKANGYFCSLQQDVENTNYTKGTILLVESKSSFQIGDKVLIRNKYADKQNSAINQLFLVGVVQELNQDQYIVTLPSYQNETIEIDTGDMVGQVTAYVLFAGHLFNNMIGIRGYIIFGIIPLLSLALLYFILRFISVPKHQEMVEDEKLEDEKPLQISAQTIRSSPNPRLTYTVDNEEDVKLFKTPQKVSDETSDEESSEMEDENIIIFMDKDDSNSMMLDETDLNEIDQKQRKRIKMIHDANPHEIMKSIAEKKEKMIHQDGKPIVMERIKEKEIKDQDEKEVEIDLKYLSADEIIQMYRNEETNANNEEEENHLNNIAMLYFDNDIEHYH